jgi:hypothetical protein
MDLACKRHASVGLVPAGQQLSSYGQQIPLNSPPIGLIEAAERVAIRRQSVGTRAAIL